MSNTTPCKFCLQPTLRTYRDKRSNNLDTNLVSSCEPCALKQLNPQGKPYLAISSVRKPNPSSEKDLAIKTMREILQTIRQESTQGI